MRNIERKSREKYSKENSGKNWKSREKCWKINREKFEKKKSRKNLKIIIAKILKKKNRENPDNFDDFSRFSVRLNSISWSETFVIWDFLKLISPTTYSNKEDISR